MIPQTPKTSKPPSEAPPLQRVRRNRSYIGHQHHLLIMDRITCRLDFEGNDEDDSEGAHNFNDEAHFSTN